MTYEDTKRHKRNLWFFLLGMLIVGMVMTVFICFNNSTSHRVSAVGVVVLIAGACFSGGGLFGFLFAIPRVNGHRDGNNLQPSDGRDKKLFIQNDNLVHISDWITKIIVGVGLTQLYNIPTSLSTAGNFLGAAFSDDHVYGSRAAIAILLYYSIMGFLTFYLWTSIYYIHFVNNPEAERKPG